MLDSLLNFLIIAAAFGGIVWIFNILPISEQIKKVATIVTLVVFVIFALKWLLGNI